jgi:hypothetical protein
LVPLCPFSFFHLPPFAIPHSVPRSIFHCGSSSSVSCFFRVRRMRLLPHPSLARSSALRAAAHSVCPSFLTLPPPVLL